MHAWRHRFIRQGFYPEVWAALKWIAELDHH